MTNESIKVRTIETKTSQKGNTYWTINLDDGRQASAFDSSFVEDVLRKSMNDNFVIEVSLEQSGAFLNIRPKRSDNNTQEQKPVAKTGFDQTAMYVSYAKDLVLDGKKPDEAISIVKQLKTGLQ